MENIKQKLNAIDTDHLFILEEIGKVSKEINQKSYLVGGMVRDLLLGFDNLDIDIVVENNAALLADTLIKKFSNCELSAKHDRFHTAKIIFHINNKKIPVDLATTREEIYEYSAALPKVEISELKKDLIRRDFTINALAVSLLPEDFGEIVDLFSGLNDLENKKIKILHEKSFIDDPTRIIRAIRFATKLGFRIEENTERLLKEAIESGQFDNLIKKIRGDRVKIEIRYLFNLPNVNEAIKIFFESGVYRMINKHLIDNKPSEETILKIKSLIEVYKIEEKWLIYLGILVNDLFIEKDKDPLTQLQLSGREISIVRNGCAKSILINNKSVLNSIIVFKELSKLSIESVLIIKGLNHSNRFIDEYLTTTSKIKLHITGQDLLSRGIPSGKKIGEILDKILELKLQNPNMSREDEMRVSLEFLN